MSANKSIDKFCIVIIAFTLVIAIAFCNGQELGIETTAHAIGYENRIFDNSKVHTIDIVMNDWDGFIENCESEEYSSCNVIIDGEAIKNVGIRAKGNTSLSSVKNMDSSRYSLKIEFDQYDNTKSYHGLDKLCLNNLIQDNTYMKDYIAYTLMNEFGVNSPLCSYAYITVNGEDWGLYLAVEGIEESFLQRNYGNNPGELYKPDSMSFGGGRGNGMDFSMTEFMNENSDDTEKSDSESSKENISPSGRPDKASRPDIFGGKMPEGMEINFSKIDPSEMFGENGEMPDFANFGGFGGMGSDDVKLKYIDDDADSYSNIFSNAKTNITLADKNRLNISDMGTMGSGGGFGGFSEKNNGSTGVQPTSNTKNMQNIEGNTPTNFTGEIPDNFDPSTMFGGEMPEGFNGNMPDGFNPPDNGNPENSETNDTPNDKTKMRNMPSINGNSPQNSITSSIMLIVSFVFLAFGIIFALKFKK